MKKTESHKRPVVLIVLDGWGYREEIKDNAIAAASTPYFDHLWASYPHSLLKASGNAVGLPEGQMGNSEVGHTTIGAGTIVDTDLVRIGKAITVGDIEKNESIKTLFDHVKKYDSVLHLEGLIGPGGVHAHSEHLYAMLRAAKESGIKKVAVHAFTDGRDTPPQSAGGYLKELEKVLEEVGIGKIATVSGRFYAMDRDNNWNRLEKATDAMYEGKGHAGSGKASDYIDNLYKDGKLDEHLEPIVFADDTGKPITISKNDGVFFFNFRADRARMLASKQMERAKADNVCMMTMTQYSDEFKCLVAFTPVKIETVLAAEISKAMMTQVHIAETEKFPHATYFLNGGREKPHEGEVHELIASRRDVPTHDLAPKMRAQEIADKAVEYIQLGVDFIFINFANPDMVGHTANIPAIIEALEETDKQLGRVVTALDKKGGVAFVTADHGNVELNVDQETGKKHTSHTTNPVPAILTDKNLTLKDGGLSDIAPTILKLLALEQPKAMTGKSLI